MVWFSKQKIMIFGLVVGLAGAYLCGWFHLIISFVSGEGVPSDISVSQSIGSLLLAIGPWVMRFSSKFAKGQEV